MKYLLGQALRVQVDPVEAEQFRHVLGRLRTFFAHNLDPSNTRDRSTRDTCYAWFKDACGSRVPGDDQWERCLEALLESALRCLQLAIDVARAIEGHPDSGTLSNMWRDRLSRTDVVVNYLGELQRAAGDLGCEGLNLNQIRDRYSKRWAEALSLIPANTDLDAATTRHMEQALLAETGRLLPVTAQDVMERLVLAPGESVEVALRLAQVLHSLKPAMDSASLLESLVGNWGQLQGQLGLIRFDGHS
ncbi:hypothetical protein [Streptacidiphilus sp. MAP12-33]|uniref:hypothetical protein n=1 Tax=Streptacidiphilus sp. MAP12-33 TaxID=3156266 RepID=UPI003517C685